MSSQSEESLDEEEVKGELEIRPQKHDLGP
jgi:hypothetical protein